MTLTRGNESLSSIVERDPTAWDAALRGGQGHLLQSWRWGAFKERFGWEVERFAVFSAENSAMAQVLFRRRAGVSLGYIPRGPVLPENDLDAVAELWERIDASARRRRALNVIVEADKDLPETLISPPKFVTGSDPIQPARTVKVDLASDEGLLAQMHPKTRYNVRMAKRRDVQVWAADDTGTAVDQFYRMLLDTAVRNSFVIHDVEYYRGFLQQFGQDAVLLFAGDGNSPVAGVVAAVFGDEAIYMYGASSKDRAHGAAFLLQHEAMRWARDRGARRYDMWGIPEHDPDSSVSDSGDRLTGSSGNDLRGLFEFKTRFGGEIVRYPRPVERQYHPFLAAIARRFYRSAASA